MRIQAAVAQAARVPVKAYIGTKMWATFQVDIVAGGIHMTGVPDEVSPLTGVEVLYQERAKWRAYPLVDHVADKTCAILERHNGRPSTRFKDLVDLVAIATTSSVDASLQTDALRREASRRNLHLPTVFDVPDRDLWEKGYRAEARRAVGLEAVTLGAALEVVKPPLGSAARRDRARRVGFGGTDVGRRLPQVKRAPAAQLQQSLGWRSRAAVTGRATARAWRIGPARARPLGYTNCSRVRWWRCSSHLVAVLLPVRSRHGPQNGLLTAPAPARDPRYQRTAVPDVPLSRRGRDPDRHDGAVPPGRPCGTTYA